MKTRKEVEEVVEMEFPWRASSKEACFEELKCPSDITKTGLSAEEAATRLAKYGPNRLAEKETVTLLERIWKQVANVLVGILVFVAIVSAIRAATAADTQNKITNWIQVGLIVFVITYVLYVLYLFSRKDMSEMHLTNCLPLIIKYSYYYFFQSQHCDWYLSGRRCRKGRRRP